MKNEINVIIHPFAVMQQIYLTGKDTKAMKCSLQDLPSMICDLAQMSERDSVNLIGAISFNSKIKKDIQEEELKRYKNNNLEINLVTIEGKSDE